jgi:antitoxin component of MazEF toxin-antitoxin module
MIEFTRKIRKVGASHVVSIPADEMETYRLHVGQRIKVHITLIDQPKIKADVEEL